MEEIFNNTYRGFRERYTFFTWAILIIIFILCGLLLVERVENKRYLENQRRLVVEQLSTIRARLEGELNAELLLARSIVTEVATNTDIKKDRFFKIAEHFFLASKHIRNIGLARGTILSYVYPVKGNEKAIGLDYTKIESQWPAVKRVIEGRKTVVAGPLNLVQGGMAIIGRTPIFIENASSELEDYFGILSVVLNTESLFEAAGLNDKDEYLKISIRGKDGIGAKGEVFYGSEDLFTNNPVLMEVKLPGGFWLMASIPKFGWEQISPRINSYRIVAVIVGFIFLLLLFVQQREMTIRKYAEKEKEKLILDLKKALSDVKQLSGLLPICASCKNIRDDKGYWKQIEGYISDHSDAEFSHSICPECAIKLYPELKGPGG